MPLQPSILTQKESDDRYDYLQKHSVAPVTLYTNGLYSITTAVPYVTQSYVLPSYSGLAFVSSNFSGGSTVSTMRIQVQLSLAPTPFFADNTQDFGNIIFCAHAVPGNASDAFRYIYQDFQPLFIPLQTNTTIYVHYTGFVAANATLAITHRLVLGLVQTGLKI